MSCRAIRMHAIGLFVVAMALIGSPAFSADWHVRPAGDCANAGDGTSPNCASNSGGPGSFTGFAGIAWSSIQPGDTLYVIGTHLGTGLVIQASGTTTSPIAIRGDLKGFSLGVIDGNGTVAACVYDNNVSHDIALIRLSIKNCTGRGVQFRNGQTVTNRSGLQLRDVHISNITGPSTGFPTCVWAYGEGVTIRNSQFESCGDDGIWITGANPVVENNWFQDIGIGTGAAGDCVQLTAADAGNFSISGNYCNHVSTDEKQCFIAYNETPTSTGGRITDNICILPRPTVPTKGIFNGYDGVLIARNFVTGGESGIWNIADAQIVANIVTSFSGVGIYVGGGASGVVLNNTVVGGYRTGRCLQSDSFSTFANNVLARCERAFAAYVGQYNGVNQWTKNVSWDNTYNTGEFGTPANNTVTGLMTSDPGFSGSGLFDPFAWRTSIGALGQDVSSYGPAALLNFSKESRASATELGAF